MNRLNVLLEPFKKIAYQYPYITGAAAIFSLTILLLRKIHYRFVVYPDIGGRHNNQNPRGYRHPREMGMLFEDIEIKTNDGVMLRGWYVKHANPEAVLIYYHENAGNIGGRLHFIQELLKNMNVSVIIVAYRGFSDSDGLKPPNEKNIMTDAKTILNKGMELSNRDRLPLFIFGRSLGGASSINALSQPQYKYAVKGLILQNTFTSIFDVANTCVPKVLFWLTPLLWMITWGSYSSINKISDIHVPILFVKGCRDTLIPKKLMDELQQRHTYMKRQNFELLVEQGGHMDTWYYGGARYFQTFKEFFGHCSKL